MQTTPLSKDDFAKLLMDRIRQAGEKGSIVYEPEEFRLRGEGKQAFAFFLGNAYKEYCSADEDSRGRVIGHWARGWFALGKDAPDDFEDVKPDLLPVVRGRSYFDLTRLRGEIESGNPASWPYQVLAEHFGVALVYDLPESMRSVQQTSLDAWGVTFYEAMEVARENLARLPAKFIGPPSGEGVYLSATRDGYDASRLVLIDLVRQFKVNGEHIAMIPNRENLVVVGSDDVKGLSGMLKLAVKAWEQPRPISGIALRLDGDEWVPWLPGVSHPLFKDFHQIQLQWLAHDYAEQKVLFDKLHEKKGEDIFVAAFSATEVPDGRVVSYTAWAAEVTHALLPKTDMVVLGRIGGERRMVQWQELMDMVGDLMEPLDIYPARYRVREFPSEKQFAAMGNVLK